MTQDERIDLVIRLEGFLGNQEKFDYYEEEVRYSGKGWTVYDGDFTVWNNGWTLRFVVDEEGVIRKINDSGKPVERTEEEIKNDFFKWVRRKKNADNYSNLM